MRRRAAVAGFATAAVLGMVAVIALLAVAAMHDALFGTQLAASRLLQLRAGQVAEFGLRAGTVILSTQAPNDELIFTASPGADSPETAVVRIRPRARLTLPGGFSAGRFELLRFEVESTAHVSRGVRATRTQGVERITPAGLAATS